MSDPREIPFDNSSDKVVHDIELLRNDVEDNDPVAFKILSDALDFVRLDIESRKDAQQ